MQAVIFFYDGDECAVLSVVDRFVFQAGALQLQRKFIRTKECLNVVFFETSPLASWKNKQT
jgi:hypothetical protein